MSGDLCDITVGRLKSLSDNIHPADLAEHNSEFASHRIFESPFLMAPSRTGWRLSLKQ